MGIRLYDEELEEPRWFGWNGYIGKYASIGLIVLSSIAMAYLRLGAPTQGEEFRTDKSDEYKIGNAVQETNKRGDGRLDKIRKEFYVLDEKTEKDRE